MLSLAGNDWPVVLVLVVVGPAIGVAAVLAVGYVVGEVLEAAGRLWRRLAH